MKAILEDADFDGPLVNYKDKGNKVEYVGIEPGRGHRRLQAEGHAQERRRPASSTWTPTTTCRSRSSRSASCAAPSGNTRSPRRLQGESNGVVPALTRSRPGQRKGSHREDRRRSSYDAIEANDADRREPIFQARPRRRRRDEDGRMSAREATESSPAVPVALPAIANWRPAQPAAAASGPSQVDSETISGLGARNIGSAAMSGRVAAIDAVHDGKRLTVYVGAASRRRLEVGQRRHHLQAGLRQAAGAVDRRHHDRSHEPEDRLGRHRRGLDAQQPSRSATASTSRPTAATPGRTWASQDSERIAQDRRRPDGRERRLRLRSRQALERQRRPRRLQDDRRRQDLDEDPQGRQPLDRLLDAGHGPAEPEDALRRHVGLPPQGLDLPLRRRRARRAERQRPLQVDRRRHDLDGARREDGQGPARRSRGAASAVAVAPSNPNVVYAFIEAEPPKNGLYRSDDGGATWQALDRSQNMVWRPFYFAHLIVDPTDANKLYKPGGSSDRQRRRRQELQQHRRRRRTATSTTSGSIPKNTDHLIAGDDGGLWYLLRRRQPLVEGRQPADLAVLPRERRHGPARTTSTAACRTTAPGSATRSTRAASPTTTGRTCSAATASGRSPTRPIPTYVYAESQGGEIGRVNRKTHATRAIKPLPRYQEGKLRFNWNTPIHAEPHARRARSTSARSSSSARATAAQTWERISPDLTTNDPEKQKQEESGGVTVDNSSAEMHTTIYSIAESPKDPNVIWVGTDDGNVQLTRDGGKTLDQRRRATCPGLPKHAWVSWVEASHFDAGTAYVDVRPPHVRRHEAVRLPDHRLRQDLDAHRAGPTARARLRARRQGGPRQPRPALPRHRVRALDLARRRRQWAQFKGGDLPNVAVRDLAIHPRDHDLVIATHGRGIWIVDDITPLRALTTGDARSEGRVSSSRTPPSSRIPASGGWANGDAEFVGAEPARRRRDHLLPADAPPLRRPEHRGLRRGRQDGRHGPEPASAAGLTRVTWSMRIKAAPGAAGGERGIRRGPGPPRPSRNVHGEADQGQGRLHRRSSTSSPIRARRPRRTIARRSSISP